jgi:hypothetical protein
LSLNRNRIGEALRPIISQTVLMNIRFDVRKNGTGGRWASSRDGFRGKDPGFGLPMGDVAARGTIQSLKG